MVDRDRRREKDKDRDQVKDRDPKRSRSLDCTYSRHACSRSLAPDHRLKSRSRSPDHQLKFRFRSPDRRSHPIDRYCRCRSSQDRKSRCRDEEVEKERFGSGTAAAEKWASGTDTPPDDPVASDMDSNEIEMMKKLGIPMGFDTTKGKPVPDAKMSGASAVAKRQPWQYMNRRGGFNRPLPVEWNH